LRRSDSADASVVTTLAAAAAITRRRRNEVEGINRIVFLLLYTGKESECEEWTTFACVVRGIVVSFYPLRETPRDLTEQATIIRFYYSKTRVPETGTTVLIRGTSSSTI
jgi:hypothetical protein